MIRPEQRAALRDFLDAMDEQRPVTETQLREAMACALAIVEWEPPL